MDCFRYLATEVASILLFHLVLGRVAHAYLDPGTGSFILQLLIGGLLGSFFAVKIYWAKIKTFLARVFHKGKKTEKGDG